MIVMSEPTRNILRYVWRAAALSGDLSRKPWYRWAVPSTISGLSGWVLGPAGGCGSTVPPAVPETPWSKPLDTPVDEPESRFDIGEGGLTALKSGGLESEAFIGWVMVMTKKDELEPQGWYKYYTPLQTQLEWDGRNTKLDRDRPEYEGTFEDLHTDGRSRLWCLSMNQLWSITRV